MKGIMWGAALSVATLGLGAAQAATLTFTVQNRITTSAITNSYLNACAPIIPGLASIPANSTSLTHQTDCGTTSAVHFDYTNGSKTCRFSLSSIYTPPNPILGTSAYWTPNGTATSRGSTSATCRATLTSIGTNGNYTWALSIQ
ncbi:hypothetical protein [Myxococcus hansupus]|nr:hypothetical protein [Myxococcus hansupus]